MIGGQDDGGPLMQDAALAWNSALSDYRISPNRQTAAALFDAAGDWALDVGPLTPGMQTELDASAYLRDQTATVPAAGNVWAGMPWGAIALAVGALVVLSPRQPRRRR